MLWTTVLENQNMVLMIIKTLVLKKHMKCLNKIVQCHVTAYTDFTRININIGVTNINKLSIMSGH